MQPMIFSPLSVTSKLNYVKFTNGDLLLLIIIIMLKCKGYICKILLCIDRFESYLKIPYFSYHLKNYLLVLLAEYDIL